MTTETRSLEREAKFEVDRDFDPPDLRDLVGRTERLPEQRLRTSYFDTVDRRLGARAITLRFRCEEDDTGAAGQGTWTLKFPAGGDGDLLERGEVSWAGTADEVPEEARSILRGLIRRSSLVEVTELETTRRRLALFGPGDADDETAWGELDDDHVNVVGGPRDGLQFRQLEVELGGGDPVVVDSILERLVSSGATPTRSSKLSTALESAAEPIRDRARRSQRKGTPLREVIQESVTVDLDRLLDQDYRIRLDRGGPNPHHVHQARVAVRRLRSDLKLFGAALDPVWTRHTDDELRWLSGVLGRVRDVDVLASTLTERRSAPSGLPSEEVLTDALGEERGRALSELSVALESQRFIDLLDRLGSIRHGPPVRYGRSGSRRTRAPRKSELKSSRALPALVNARWKALAKSVKRLERHPGDEQLHAVRIRAKRLRYAAETAAPYVGKPAVRTARAAEGLQTVLGEYLDARAGERWLRKWAYREEMPSDAHFLAGALFDQMGRRGSELRPRWRSGWRKLNRKKCRSWLAKSGRPGSVRSG